MRRALLAITLSFAMLLSPATAFADPAAGTQTPSGVALSELEAYLDAYMSGHIGTTVAGAQVVVIEHDQVLVSKAYGQADVEAGTPASRNSVFEWGSASKLLVWVSAMQLAERGQLDLDADIRQYLPAGFFTRLQYDDPITMYNLMHHNAGWEELPTGTFFMSPDTVPSLEQTLRQYEPKQVFRPGEVVSYSNYATALAGYIVEQITGQPFYEYVNNNIFKPLNMDKTSLHPTLADNAVVAEARSGIKGHLLDANGAILPSPNERAYIGLYPAGSAIGAADDAAKFLAALLPAEGEASPLFADRKTLDLLLTTSQSYGDGFAGIAHGFWERQHAVMVLCHPGNTESFSTIFAFSPECGLGLVLMVNQAGENAVCYGLVDELFGRYSPEAGGALPGGAPGGALPDARELAGLYIMPRRAHSGFGKLLGVATILPIAAVDENTISLAGIEYVQVSPYVFVLAETDDPLAANLLALGNLNFVVEDGEVIGISAMTVLLLPVTTTEVVILGVSLAVVVVSLIYLIVSVLIIIIGAIRNRRKKEPSNLVKRLNMLLCLSIAVPFANILAMLVRLGTYANSFGAHFAINIAYIAFAPICSIAIIVNMRKHELSKGRKFFYTLSCIISVLLAIFLVYWEFYK